MYIEICICGHEIDDHFQQEMWQDDEMTTTIGQCLVEDCDCEIYEDITNEEEI